MFIYNLTVFNDLGPCVAFVWALLDGEWTQIFIGEQTDCVFTLKNSNPKLVTDTIKIRNCGYTWSSIDSVQMCGELASIKQPTITIKNPSQNGTVPAYMSSLEIKIETDVISECRYKFEDFNYADGIKFDNTNNTKHSTIITGLTPETNYKLYYKCKSTYNVVNTISTIHEFHLGSIERFICQYAQTATATSENIGSEAIYATGAPDCDEGDYNCTIWSGTQKSWNAINYDVKANITLHYQEPIFIQNITIFGDLFPCYAYIWILNDESWIPVFIGENMDCKAEFKELSSNELITTIKIQNCGYSWASIDAVQICGEVYGYQEPRITIKNPLQSQILPIDTTSVEIKIQTDSISECRYNFIDFNYNEGILFTNTNSINHSFNLTGLTSNSTYTLYYKCKNQNNITNNQSIIHEFTIDALGLVSCQYATSAEANSELPGHEAKYATGTPDSDDNCTSQPLLFKSWQKTSLDLENITFTFPNEIYPKNLTLFGDYDLCIRKIWLWRNESNSWYLTWNGRYEGSTSICHVGWYPSESTNGTNSVSFPDFKTNKIKLQTCSGRWSTIDSIQACGSTSSFPSITIVEPKQDMIIDNSSTSVDIEIQTDIVSECRFSYNKEFNFEDGMHLSTTEGITHSGKILHHPFKNKVRLYYKCKNSKVTPYSTEHRFSFNILDSSFLEICNWYNCSEGAASISGDDGFHPTTNTFSAACDSELRAHGLKGTYFLAYTEKYNESIWDIFRDAYNAGHEIGGHMADCSINRSKENYTNDLQSNINDIVNNIGVQRDKLTTFAWPCGIKTPDYKEWVSDYYKFARGYHQNLIESKDPKDMMNLRSINNIGFGDTPPDYFTLADIVDNHQDWVDYVFHPTCDNPEIIDYLISKDIWIDSVGTVAKYIEERKNSRIQNFKLTATGATFNLVTDLNLTVFNKELSLKLYLGDDNINFIKVNGGNIAFTEFTKNTQRYAKFSLLPSGNDSVEISGLDFSLPYCGDAIVNQGSEECDDGNIMPEDGCNAQCKLDDPSKIYIINYMGDINGGVATSWYPFFDLLTTYFENNGLKVGFAFFPYFLDSTNTDFMEIFQRMYSAENIELIQKGYRSNATEAQMDNLSLEMQREIIRNGQQAFLKEMGEFLGTSNIELPVTYNPPFGRFTQTTRTALQQLGFRTNTDVYYPYNLEPVPGTPSFDVTQYGVSFTESGSPGREQSFRQPEDIYNEIINFEDRGDVEVITINGAKVIPLYAHQQDFEHVTLNGVINMTKWKIYNQTLMMLYNNENVTFITPKEVWEMRHPFCIPTGISETFCNRIDDDCDGKIDEECILPSNIVLLAMDDIQSFWLEDVQEYVIQQHILNNIPLTLGVIPASISEPMLTKIKEWDSDLLIEAAQHDYNHSAPLIGKNYTYQYNYLKQGTDLFNSWGIYPKSFIPSGGEADDTTIQVIKDLGFNTFYDVILDSLTPSTHPLVLQDQSFLCINGETGHQCRFKEYPSLKYEIDQKIQKYGVGLVLYHMQDFETSTGSINTSKVNKLIDYADNLTKDGYTLMTVNQYYQYLNLKEINISLTQGWNLISIPLDNQTVGSLFKDIGYSYIFAYSNGKWHQLVNSSSINKMQGYWINSLNNQTLNIPRAELSNPPYDLNTGWNLVGYPSLITKPVNAVFDVSEINSVSMYNNSKWYSYAPDKPDSLNTLKQIKPGYGYWVMK